MVILGLFWVNRFLRTVELAKM